MLENLTNLHAIVLYHYEYKESSRMVDVFSRERGRLSFAARGARRNKSQTLNLTERYIEGEFNLVGGRTHYYLKDGLLLDAHLPIRQDLDRIAAADFALELFSRVSLAQEDQELYQLLSALLGAAEEAEAYQLSRLLAAFLLKLMSFLGFRPTLGHYLDSGEEVKDSGYWDLLQGGMVSSQGELSAQRVWLDQEDYQEICAYIRLSLHDIIVGAEKDKLSFYIRMERICLRYYQLHTENDKFRSRPFLEQRQLI